MRVKKIVRVVAEWPIIGRFVRIMVAIIRLPENNLDYFNFKQELHNELQNVALQLSELRQTLIELNQDQSELRQRLTDLNQHQLDTDSIVNSTQETLSTVTQDLLYIQAQQDNVTHSVNRFLVRLERTVTGEMPTKKSDIIFNQVDIEAFLLAYKDTEIIYVPNPGNAGDSLIAHATIQLFDRLELNYILGNHLEKYTKRVLFFGGGGNLVGLYKDCFNFIENNKNDNEIVLLPHTVNNEDELIKSLGDNVTIICREKRSFAYVHSLIKDKNKVLLAPDLAFSITGLDKYKSKTGSGTLNCYREDCEKTTIPIPSGNIDLSMFLLKAENTDNKEIIKQVSESVFEYVSDYSMIKTNRLHIAIAGSLLNKAVIFNQNSYFKNEAVYEYMIKNNFENTVFIF